MRNSVAVAALVGLLDGCGSSSMVAPAGPDDIGGNWSYSENISNTPLQTSCNANGTATINQNGVQFSGNSSGTETCTNPGGARQQATAGPITGGQIWGGNHVSFETTGCSFSGTVSGSPTNLMSGNVTCTLAVNGTAYQFTGTWTASR